MRTGALNRVISIEHNVGSNASGAANWAVFRENIMAEVTSRRGVEHLDNSTGQRYSESITRFRTHYHEAVGIRDDMKVIFEGQRYDIRVIMPDHVRKQDCIIDCALTDGVVKGDVTGLNLFTLPVNNARVGDIYIMKIKVQGGAQPITMSAVTSGSPSNELPPGLTFSQIDLDEYAIEGIPTVAGVYTLKVRATDGGGAYVESQDFSITVAS